MPDPNQNPLNALRKATTMTSAKGDVSRTPMTQSMMPMAPPAGIAATLGSVARGAANLPSEAISGLQRAAPTIHQLTPENNAMMEKMYNATHPVYEAMRDAGQFIGDRTTGALKSIWPAAAEDSELPAAITNRDLTPVGAESAYNMAQPGPGKPQFNDPIESAYRALVARGGR